MLNGEQLGVLPIVQALEFARLKGVDLIEIAATANPPICRLIDFAKYKYEQKKIKGADQKSSDAAPPSKPNEIDLSEYDCAALRLHHQLFNTLLLDRIMIPRHVR